MTMGERIRAAREKNGITQETLGGACGVAKQTIFKYESGVITNIPLDKLEQMAELLDVSPAWTLGWEQPEKAALSAQERLYENGAPTLEEIVVGIINHAEGRGGNVSAIPPEHRSKVLAAYELAEAIDCLDADECEKLLRYARYLDKNHAPVSADAPTTIDEFRFAGYLMEQGIAPEDYDSLPDPGNGLRTVNIVRAHKFLALYDSLTDERRKLADEFMQLLAGQNSDPSR